MDDIIYFNDIYYKNRSITNKNVNRSILITGGIGDFFTLDFFYDLSIFHNYYIIAPQCEIIKGLIVKLYNKNNDDIDILNCKTIGYECFFTKGDILNCNKIDNMIKERLKDYEDYGIFVKFPEIKQILRYYNNLKYNTSILKQIRDISHLNLPDKYYVICPYTDNYVFDCIKCNRIHESICELTGNRRNFIKRDWDNTLTYLEKNGLIGVIIGNKKVSNIRSNWIIDLEGQTLFEESIEIMRNGNGYIGIDSCFSVIACYLFHKNNIYIKATNKHAYNYKELYFYNKEEWIEPKLNILI